CRKAGRRVYSPAGWASLDEEHMVEAAGGASPQIIDMRMFWRAVGQRASGSTVVTASGREGPAGFLGLSSSHVCAEPPIMLVAIDKRTAALATVRESGHFALNYLARGAETLAVSFGGKGTLRGVDRFTTTKWRTLVTGAPVLEDAVGAIDCTVEEMI